MSKPVFQWRVRCNLSSPVRLLRFISTRSGTPILPMSCSKAAISSDVAADSSMLRERAQVEQPTATRRQCEAVRACLERKATNNPDANPRRACAKRFSRAKRSTSCGFISASIMLVPDAGASLASGDSVKPVD